MPSSFTPDSNLQHAYGPTLTDVYDEPFDDFDDWSSDVGLGPRELLTFDLLSEDPLPSLPLDDLPLNDPPIADPPIADQSAPVVGDDVPSGFPKNPSPGGEFWLDGGVVMCGCPDCQAPMTVRIWLMIADCWNCSASIELTEEQEQQIRQLLEQQEDAASPPPLPPPAPPPDPPPSRERRPSAHSSPPPAARAQRRAQTAQAASPRYMAAAVRDFFRMTPAWLISLILHFILLTLLALFMLPYEEDPRLITLSTSVSEDVEEGVEQILDAQVNAEFDLPIPHDADIDDKEIRQFLQKADQDARELRIDPDASDAPLPDLSRVKQQMAGNGGVHRSFLARDPRLRVEMIKKEGGTTLTEAAVARGLNWLARVQNRDGSWSLHRFGGIHCDAAGTSLALLPFLGAGQTHLSGRYKETVAKGIRWMLDHQLETGDLRAGERGQPGMYAHGQAAIVMCEAFAMTGDEQLRRGAQTALDFIVKAQHLGGGWRYRPGDSGDTSVLGWQLMALQSGRAANLHVPEHTLEMADHFLDTVKDRRSPQYLYRVRGHANAAMTAEALLCRIYLGWRKDSPGLSESIEYLMAKSFPRRSQADIYYWYYGTQTLHHYGGPLWEQWNRQMRDLLVSMQDDRGRYAGSWAPRGAHSSSGGRIYMTALAVCCLEVYYRHLPIFRQIELEQSELQGSESQ